MIMTTMTTLLVALLLALLFSDNKNVDASAINAGSDPKELTMGNDGKVFFAAKGDSKTGRELWTTDGYLAGARLFADLNPGPGDSNPQGFTWFDNKLWFSAYDGEHGVELFSVASTLTSAKLFHDINAGGASSNPSHFFAWQGKLWFAADGGTGTGTELWVTEGSISNARQWMDINPGAGSSSPRDFVVFRDALYFTADDGTKGRQLWTSDGTTGGTKLKWDLGTNANPAEPVVLKVNTGNSTVTETLFFVATSEEAGRELFSVNHTFLNPPPQVFEDINPGSASSDPQELTHAPDIDRFVFSAFTPEQGRELWNTNGHPDPAERIMTSRDIFPGPQSSNPTCLWSGFQFKMYFAATGSADKGSELWSIGGDLNDLDEHQEIYRGSSSSNPCDFVISPGGAGGIIFSADDGEHGRELWNNDGHLSVKLLTDINKESSGSPRVLSDSSIFGTFLTAAAVSYIVAYS